MPLTTDVIDTIDTIDTHVEQPRTKITINDQSRYALNILEKTSDNIFLTGKAGTGKSTLLNLFRDNTKKHVVVLAPTGIAALNVRGQTIHSFFKFKPNVTIESVQKKASKEKHTQFFNAIDAIIIDEISMVRADLLDCIDIFLQTTLKNQKPFGGKQMIFIGDLYQLAPVVTKDEHDFFKEVYTSPYFFSSRVIENNNLTMHYIELEKIYRQSEDGFIAILNGVRNNTLTDTHLNALNKRVNPHYSASEGEIHLTTTNAHAHELNMEKLHSLNTPVITSEAIIEGDFDVKLAPAECTLALTVDSQVMLLNNDASGLWVNGTIGKITKCDIQKNTVEVKLTNGSFVLVKPYTWTVYTYAYDAETRKLKQETNGSFTQYPLKLAWAMTIHKSQGKTFDRVIVDLGRGAFAEGQVYVGLTRCRTINGLTLKKPLRRNDVKVNQSIIQFLTKYHRNQGTCRSTQQVQAAINNEVLLEIVYLKTTGEQVTITIQPLYVGLMFYQESYLGIRGYNVAEQKDVLLAMTRIVQMTTLSETIL